MNDKTDYFDIKKLYKILDANGWSMGKNFMKFWADGQAKIAILDPVKKNKSTIGVNLNQGLRVYTVSWNWLNRFNSTNTQYQRFYSEKVKNAAVCSLLRRKYVQSTQTKLVTHFNEWLIDGLQPWQYQKYIKEHQMQHIAVDSYDMNGNKFNDLVAALNGFNLFAFYKGLSISGPAYRKKLKEMKDKKDGKVKPKPGKPGNATQKDEMDVIPKKDREGIESFLKQPNTKGVVYVTDVGIYAGDIYEFNGNQYLATWSLKKNTVEISKWDWLVGTSDTDDEDDLAITNETYNIYRSKTGMGGDFLALSPIKLKRFPFIVQVR